MLSSHHRQRARTPDNPPGGVRVAPGRILIGVKAFVGV